MPTRTQDHIPSLKSIQGQLSKATSKSTSRGGVGAKGDSGASPPIVISKPLKRNFSQEAGEGTLQMAEVAAAKSTIASLEVGIGMGIVWYSTVLYNLVKYSILCWHHSRLDFTECSCSV